MRDADMNFPRLRFPIAVAVGPAPMFREPRHEATGRIGFLRQDRCLRTSYMAVASYFDEGDVDAAFQ
jgi:hypothetical protein